MIEWFDDLAIGMRFKSDEVQITESDIKRFAAEYDPQPMHLKRDDFSSNRLPALSLCLSMILSENRYPLFRIML